AGRRTTPHARSCRWSRRNDLPQRGSPPRAAPLLYGAPQMPASETYMASESTETPRLVSVMNGSASGMRVLGVDPGISGGLAVVEVGPRAAPRLGGWICITSRGTGAIETCDV